MEVGKITQLTLEALLPKSIHLKDAKLVDSAMLYPWLNPEW